MAPNTIDFSTLDFDPTKNPAIYITLGVILGMFFIQNFPWLYLAVSFLEIIWLLIPLIILGLYIFVMIWARRADKKDLTYLGCTPLECNDPLDKYLYEILVQTGARKDAGTKSKVGKITKDLNI